MRILPYLLLALLVSLVGCPDGGDDDDLAGDDDVVQQDDDATDDDDTTENLPPCESPLDAVEIYRGEPDDGTGYNCEELNVALVHTQAQYEGLFEYLFPFTASNYGIPEGIDFETSTLILSYITRCGAIGYSLIVDWVCLDGETLDVYETLWHPDDGYIAEDGIPLNLTTIPKGDYFGVEGHLTLAYPEPEK